MLQIYKYLLRQNVHPSTQCKILRLPALYSTFQPREFQFETSDGESGTLIHRFSRHVALTKRDFTDPTPYNFKYSSFFPVYAPSQFLKELRNLDSHDMGKLISMTSVFRGKNDVRLVTDVINALDEETHNRVSGTTFSELVGILHGYMYLLPNKITKLKTYQEAMPRLVKLFKENVNEKDFITVAFFLGLWKKNGAGGKLLDKLLKDHLDTFLNDQMGLMDFAILANASFKTAVRVNDARFRERLVQEICGFQGDDVSILITLIKCARMNQLKSDQIVEKIGTIMQTNASILDFRGLSHLFAYIADNLIQDDTLHNLFLEECSKRIEHEILHPSTDTLSQGFRVKDLATFLWACSTLSIPFRRIGVEPSDLLGEIFRRLENAEYRYIPDTLVETCLWMWTLGHPSIDLLSGIFSERQFQQHFRRDRVKIDSRRDLLLACAEIERPQAFKIISSLPRINAYQLHREAPDYLVSNRKQLQQAMQYLESASDVLGIQQVQYSHPIKSLNIAGLYVKLNGGDVVNVDILDKRNCLSDLQTPMGLLGLKQHLLRQMGVRTVLVNSIPAQTDEQFHQILEAAIRPAKTKEQRKAGQ